MSRKSSSKHVLGYPYNLVEDVLQEECQDILDQDRIDGIETAVNTLSERERCVFELRYRRELTLREAGVLLNVGSERVRQIQAKALRKLRTPSRIRLIKYGRTFVETENEVKKLQAEVNALKVQLLNEKFRLINNGLTEEEVKQADMLAASIYELNLSVRSTNCLHRSNIKTLGDLIDFCEKYRAYDPYGTFGLCRIRNMGQKSCAEIIQKLKEVWGFSLEAYFKKQDEEKENNK